MAHLVLVLLAATLAVSVALPQPSGSTVATYVLSFYDYEDESRLVSPQEVANTGDYPWVVHLKVTLPDDTTTDCGGTLVTASVVLTAAQCVVRAVTIIVTAGTLDPATVGATGQVSGGTATSHPGFRKRQLVHDIAIVRLLSPFTVTGFVSPIQVLRTDRRLEDLPVRVLGWGPKDGTATIGTALNFADMMVLTKKDCADTMLEIAFEYASSHSCLDTDNKRKGFCYGDTGGPVVFKFSGETSYTLVGIMSDFPACPSAYPDAFTRVQPYYHWIKTNVPKGLLTSASAGSTRRFISDTFGNGFSFGSFSGSCGYIRRCRRFHKSRKPRRSSSYHVT